MSPLGPHRTHNIPYFFQTLSAALARFQWRASIRAWLRGWHWPSGREGGDGVDILLNQAQCRHLHYSINGYVLWNEEVRLFESRYRHQQKRDKNAKSGCWKFSSLPYSNSSVLSAAVKHVLFASAAVLGQKSWLLFVGVNIWVLSWVEFLILHSLLQYILHLIQYCVELWDPLASSPAFSCLSFEFANSLESLKAPHSLASLI